MEGVFQERERSLLMHWVNTRLELQSEFRTPTGRYYMDNGGLSWEINTLDRMIALSIPRFRSLGLEEENKYVLEAFEGMLGHYPPLERVA